MSTAPHLKAKTQGDPQLQAAYNALRPAFDVARQLVAARNRAGLSQSEVARRMGTAQSTVARLESGKSLPAMNSLQRYATAIGHTLQVRLVPPKPPKEAQDRRPKPRK